MTVDSQEKQPFVLDMARHAVGVDTEPPVKHVPFAVILPVWLRHASTWFTAGVRFPVHVYTHTPAATTTPGTPARRARAYALGNLVCCALTTLLLVRISYAQRDFFTALSDKQHGVPVPVTHACSALYALQATFTLRVASLQPSSAWLPLFSRLPTTWKTE